MPVITYPCGCIEYQDVYTNTPDPHNPHRKLAEQDAYCNYYKSKTKTIRKSVRLLDNGDEQEHNIEVFKCERLNQGN